jgi:iduronate 2-sulfatase
VSQPNVLFIVSDQHKKAVTGCYGNPLVRTPNIDRLSRNGVLFTRAYCACPLCGPSRSAMLTGTHVHTCGVWHHGFMESLPELPTLGSAWRRAGYVTGAFGKLHVAGETRERDLGFDERALRIYTSLPGDYWEAVGEETVWKYGSYLVADRPRRNPYNCANVPIDMDTGLMFDDLVVERSIAFLKEHRRDRFFLWVGIEKPHPEWYAPEEFHRFYRKDQVPVPATVGGGLAAVPKTMIPDWMRMGALPKDKIRGAITAYYANVSYVDWNVGRLLAALDDLGLERETVVVYTSDHGDNLFEHGLIQKHCFYEGAVAVPLIVANPELLPAGRECLSLASLIDLFPTLLELGGLDAPPTLEGRSLVAAARGGGASPDEAVFSEFYGFGVPTRMIRTPEWKYIHAQDGAALLFDARNDPSETRNLAGEGGCEAVRRELKARVLSGWEFPREGIPWDAESPGVRHRKTS